MMKSSGDVNPHRQLSLKWKAVIAVTLVLALTYSLFYALYNSELIYAWHEKMANDGAKTDASLANYIRYSNRQLFSLTASLSDLIAKNASTAANRQTLLAQFNRKIVPRLRQLGISYAALVNQDGIIQLDWRSQSNNELPWENNIPHIAIDKQQFGRSRIYCQTTCLQLSLNTIEGYQKPVMYLLLAQDFDRVLRQFITDNDTDFALLVPSNFRESLEHPKENYLATWKSRLFLLHSPNNELRDMLQDIQISNSLATLSSSRITRKFRDYFYTISNLNLPDNWFLQPSYAFKITKNATSPEYSLQSFKFVSTALGSVVLSAIILLLILWRPLSKLNTIVSSLPLLAQSRFSQFEQALKNISHSRTFSDEVDNLSNTAATLTKQLAGLHQQIDAHAEKLALNMELSKRKMDFIEQVLDTAQVIILTQNIHGKVLLINDYGLSLMGYQRDDVIGQPFENFIEYENDNQHEWAQINDVASGAQKRLCLDSKLLCQTGRHRDITWLHSHLANDANKNSACLLSVGLDVTEAKIAEKHILWMAEHDSLTGLNNRHSFQNEVDNILKLSARYHQKVAIMFLDLDNFKHINDTQGHQAGDLVIKHIAHTLKRILRNSDILARIGGDEFAITLPHIDAEGAETVASSINKAFAELTFPGSSPMNRLSASIGISIYPDHGNTCKDLLASADLAMYRAKQRGRACWQMYSPDESGRQQLHQEVIWRQRIETALEKNLFVLLYQPIMNLHSGEISHYEALIRMQDNDGELIKPTPFINIAERCGLISEIDRWVLHAVSEKLSELESNGSHIHISVNLSAHAFSDKRLLNLMSELSMKNFLNASNMILEITETEALQDFSSACQLIKNLKNLGYKFALDDFGAGFSSFYYLQQLPVDYIKIDGGFIQNLANNPQNQILVKAITDVAKGFGKRSIAEYVEDAGTLALLSQYHVDFAQGFQIGRPQKHIHAPSVHKEVVHAE